MKLANSIACSHLWEKHEIYQKVYYEFDQFRLPQINRHIQDASMNYEV